MLRERVTEEQIQAEAAFHDIPLEEVRELAGRGVSAANFGELVELFVAMYPISPDVFMRACSACGGDIWELELVVDDSIDRPSRTNEAALRQAVRGHILHEDDMVEHGEDEE